MFSTLLKKNEKGFTLIELMIVIAIIGILAAIAIPQFSAYRIRSFNAAAQADLRNAATAQEAYFVDNQIYSAAIADLVGATYGMFSTENVTVSIAASGATSYTMTGVHSAGNKTWQLVGPGGSITEQ